MGQIVGLKAKPKRCNLNALGSVPTPAAGEYILVSYDNSMTANGQGNFDRYIMGDGRTAATALELKYLDDSTRPYIVEEVNKAVADIQPIEITGDVTNAPDEEDLTSENQGGTDVLKFKDKAYNSTLYSGLGRVYLRKNIVTLEGTGKNVLTQAMVNTANTIYHIQYDYDLNGQTITLPANATLQFEGGSLANGTIIGNHTKVSSENVCFKKSLEFSGSWDSVIYSRWFEFVSVNDEYIENEGITTRNPNPTDNILCFKQIQAIVNGTGAGKVEFEKDQYLQAKITNEVHVSNLRTTKEYVIMWFEDADVDVNLNGTTIKELYTTSVKSLVICCINCNAKIHDGKIIGVAREFDYPDYTDYNGVVKNNYEFRHGISQVGGYVELCNLVVTNFTGDCLSMGSDKRPDGPNVDEILVGNYYIHDVECSYCGRNGITCFSSENGIVERVHIHHIGSDAGDAEIGSDGIQGRLPRSGMDIEYHDAANALGTLTIRDANIHDCGRYAIVGSQLTEVIKLTIENSVSVGALNVAAIVGEKEINNTLMINTSGTSYRGVITRNSIIKITDGTLYVNGAIFENVTLYDEIVEGGITDIFNLADWSQYADNYQCIFKNSTLTLSSPAKLNGITFDGCTLNINTIGSIYVSATTFIGCKVIGSVTESGKNVTFTSSGTQLLSEYPMKAFDTIFENIQGSSNSSQGLYARNESKFGFEFDGCTLKNCTSISKEGHFYANRTKISSHLHQASNPTDNTKINNKLDGCVCIDYKLQAFGSSLTRVCNSYMEYIFDPNANVYTLEIENTIMRDVTPNRITNLTATLLATNSSISLKFDNYGTGTWNLINSYLIGINEANYTGAKSNSFFAVPIPNSGTTAQRPSASVAGVGFKYFDTDIARPIWSDGENWTDAIPQASSATPTMNGIATAGNSSDFARNDHVHPSDDSKQDVISDLSSIRNGAIAGATAYQKPITGIPLNEIADIASVLEWERTDYGTLNINGANINSALTGHYLMRIDINPGQYSKIKATWGHNAEQSSNSAARMCAFYNNDNVLLGVADISPDYQSATIETTTQSIPAGATKIYVYNRPSVCSSPSVYLYTPFEKVISQILSDLEDIKATEQ